MKQTAGWMLRKCVRMLVLLLLVSAASFFLVSLSPMDPLQSNVGQAALGAMSQEQVEELKEYWGVGTPALERFISCPAFCQEIWEPPFSTEDRLPR